MADKNLVVQSINNEDESRCVDVFQRTDGTYGYEEFRRDREDGRGWFPIGMFGDDVFPTAKAALAEARSKITWLKNDNR